VKLTIDGKDLDITPTLVTPRHAATLLINNTHNRPIRKPFLRQLVKAMKEGDFRFVGDPVRISVDGTILDGQHRLTAIVLSDVPQTLMLLTGLANEDQLYMDQGQRRSPGNQVGLQLEVPQANAVAGVGRLVHRWLNGNIVHPQYPTNPELVRFIREDEEGFVSAMQRSKILARDAKAGGAPSGAALYRMNLINPALATRLFEGVSKGAGLEEGNPILTLRNALVGRRVAERWTAEEELETYIRTWNYLTRNKSLKTLKVRGGSPLVEESFQIAGG
jgi:hypothetical protein